MNRDVGDTLNIAHRGARSLAPENTLAAAGKALEFGADMWELDVGMTADGVLILVHDDTLERTSNVADLFPERQPWFVRDFTLDEIRRLDCGSWFNDQDPFDQIALGNVSRADQASYAGLPAPMLLEALTFTRDNDWRVNVEIKDLSGTPGDSRVVEQVMAMVEDLGMVGQVLISSFNHSYLERIRAVNRHIATGALTATPVDDPAALLRQLNAQAYHPLFSMVEPDAIAALRKQEFDVFVWTVNEEERMRTLAEASASGIITDFPQVLKPILGHLN